jgi:hypothetical protein
VRHPFFVVLIALLSPAGCSTPGPGPTTERVVLNQPREEPHRRDPRLPPEWFEEQIRAAEEERRAGETRAAVERIHAARAQHPGPEHEARLKELLELLNRDVLELDTLEAVVLVERDPIRFNEPLELRVHFENPGTRAVRVPAAVEGATGSLYVLEVTRREFDVRAQVVTNRRRVFVPMPSDLAIAAGGSADHRITIPAEQPGVRNDLPLAGFREYTIGGHLRPVVLEVGGLRRWDSVPLGTGTLRSFRPNYEHLADDPVGRIEQAIEKGAGVHLLTAAALVPYARRRAAVDLLVDALQGGRPVDWAMFAALQYLTGVELGRDAAAWRAWWPRVRGSFFLPRPGRRDPGIPVFGE